MLTFLAICARKRLTVDSYDDDAVGPLEKGANGKLWMARVTLAAARALFAGHDGRRGSARPNIHHQSHEECFIANSVKTEVARGAARLKLALTLRLRACLRCQVAGAR